MAVDNVYVDYDTVTITVSSLDTGPDVGAVITGATSGSKMVVTSYDTGSNTITGRAGSNFTTGSPGEAISSSCGNMVPANPTVSSQNETLDGTTSHPWQGPYGVQNAIDNIVAANGTKIYIKGQNDNIDFKEKLLFDVAGGDPDKEVWTEIIPCSDAAGWNPITGTNRQKWDFGGLAGLGVEISEKMFRFHNLRFSNVSSAYIFFRFLTTSKGIAFWNCRFDTCGQYAQLDGISVLFYNCVFDNKYSSTAFNASGGGRARTFINCNIDCCSGAIRTKLGGWNFINNIIKNLSAIDLLITDSLDVSGSAVFKNNTFYNTTNLFTDPPSGNKHWDITFLNNILHFNNPSTGLYRVADAFHSSICDYNATNHAGPFPADAGSNNITGVSDFGFVDAGGGDFRLKTDSVCLNGGMPTLNSGFTSIGCWQRQQDLSCLLVR